MAARRDVKKIRKQSKPKPKLDPVRQQDLKRLSALDAIMDPFWSARSGHHPSFS